MPAVLNTISILMCYMKRAGEAGFTLLESLLGMLAIATTIVAITPPIFLDVATRVQNRRAEQAMQLAQGEIDRVRVLIEQGNYTATALPPVPATSPSNIKDVSAPTATASSPAGITASKALQVDIDKDNKTDFLVQTFRDSGTTLTVGTNHIPIAFRMGVRVYAAVAEQNLAHLDTQRASLQFTTGLGHQRSRPLAVIYTTVARSDSNLSLEKYRELFPTP